MRSKSVVSLFAGCGGLDLGFINAGYDIIWANEIMPDAATTYKNNLGHSPVVGDIWEIIDSVPKGDVLIGGPPCQAFSLVGKRLENDPRAKLVFAYKSIVEKMMPRVFVMENVPGCDFEASYTPGSQIWNEGYPVWWHLTNVRVLKEPIPCRGNVGMWELPEGIAAILNGAEE